MLFAKIQSISKDKDKVDEKFNEVFEKFDGLFKDLDFEKSIQDHPGKQNGG